MLVFSCSGIILCLRILEGMFLEIRDFRVKARVTVVEGIGSLSIAVVEWFQQIRTFLIFKSEHLQRSLVDHFVDVLVIFWSFLLRFVVAVFEQILEVRFLGNKF